MDRRRAAGLLLALAACFATATAAPTASNHTALDLYDGAPEGCYYNFQHYGEGDRIMTNEPCLNCTCHNRMLMCYLRVCPFTKPIGQDCTIEKRADQCCPIVTCPDVPVDLLTSTTTSPAEYGSTGMGKLDKFGCSINGKYFSEGSKVPPTPNKPCEHCYCIRNMTTCVMQECTLHVDGCTPIYHKDVCCPVRYSCDHPEDEMPLLDDLSTTVRPTPGFLLTTTTISPVTQMSQDCVYDNKIFPDGALIKTEKACDHCYCMKGDIVCVVQECGTPMENEGKNCTALPPREGVCCPDTYICEGDEPSTGNYEADEFTTHDSQEKLTTLSPPRRTSSEGSGYRNEPDEVPYTDSPILEPAIEGSGEDEEDKHPNEITTDKPKSESTDDILASTEEAHEFIPLTTTKPKEEEKTTAEIGKEDESLITTGDIDRTTESQQYLPSSTGLFSTKDFEEPLTDKIEDIGSGEPPEDVFKPHKEVFSSSVLPVTEENVATTEINEQNIIVSGITEQETSEPQALTTSTPFWKEKDTKTSEHDTAINEISDFTTAIPTHKHDVTPATTPVVEQSIETFDSTDSTKILEQTTTKDLEPSNLTTLRTPTIEEEVKETTKYVDQNVATTAPEDFIKENNLETQYYPSSTSAPSLDDEFVTTEAQELFTDRIKEIDYFKPQHVTASTPMLEEIEKDTTEYTEPENIIPSGATQDTFNVLSSTVSNIPVTENEIVETTISEDHISEDYLPGTVNISIFDQQKTTTGYENLPETPIDTSVEDSSKPVEHISITTTSDLMDNERKTTPDIGIPVSQYDKEGHEFDSSTTTSALETEELTTEPDKGLNTIPSEGIEEEIPVSHEVPKPTATEEKVTEEIPVSHEVPKPTATEEKVTTEADLAERISTDGDNILSSTISSVLITKEEQPSRTTEPAFRKEDYSPTEAQISPKSTTATVDVTEKVTSTLTNDHTKSTEFVTELQQESGTTLGPKYTESIEITTLAKEISDAPSYESVTTEISVSEIIDDKYTTSKPLHEKETTVANQEDNEIFNEPRIPGEGDCLLNGVTYTNESAVPSTDKCQSGCKCLSSIIKCDPIICSPPPEYMDNCETMYDTPNACCPTYICDHKTETIPPQSHSQMSGTEAPVILPVHCHGDECEISEDKPTDSCKSGDCTGSSDEPKETTPHSGSIADKQTIIQTEECVGDECKQVLCTDENGCQATPVRPCEGEKCISLPDVILPPETQQCIDCDASGTKLEDSPPTEICTGKDGCPNVPQLAEEECKEDHCRRKDSSDQPLGESCTTPDCKATQTHIEAPVVPVDEDNKDLTAITEKLETTALPETHEIVTKRPEHPRDDSSSTISDVIEHSTEPKQETTTKITEFTDGQKISSSDIVTEENEPLLTESPEYHLSVSTDTTKKDFDEDISDSKEETTEKSIIQDETIGTNRPQEFITENPMPPKIYVTEPTKLYTTENQETTETDEKPDETYVFSEGSGTEPSVPFTIESHESVKPSVDMKDEISTDITKDSSTEPPKSQDGMKKETISEYEDATTALIEEISTEPTRTYATEASKATGPSQETEPVKSADKIEDDNITENVPQDVTEPSISDTDEGIRETDHTKTVFDTSEYDITTVSAHTDDLQTITGSKSPDAPHLVDEDHKYTPPQIMEEKTVTEPSKSFVTESLEISSDSFDQEITTGDILEISSAKPSPDYSEEQHEITSSQETKKTTPEVYESVTVPTKTPTNTLIDTEIERDGSTTTERTQSYATESKDTEDIYYDKTTNKVSEESSSEPSKIHDSKDHPITQSSDESDHKDSTPHSYEESSEPSVTDSQIVSEKLDITSEIPEITSTQTINVHPTQPQEENKPLEIDQETTTDDILYESVTEPPKSLDTEPDVPKLPEDSIFSQALPTTDTSKSSEESVATTIMTITDDAKPPGAENDIIHEESITKMPQFEQSEVPEFPVTSQELLTSKSVELTTPSSISDLEITTPREEIPKETTDITIYEETESSVQEQVITTSEPKDDNIAITATPLSSDSVQTQYVESTPKVMEQETQKPDIETHTLPPSSLEGVIESESKTTKQPDEMTTSEKDVSQQADTDIQVPAHVSTEVDELRTTSSEVHDFTTSKPFEATTPPQDVEIKTKNPELSYIPQQEQNTENTLVVSQEQSTKDIYTGTEKLDISESINTDRPATISNVDSTTEIEFETKLPQTTSESNPSVQESYTEESFRKPSSQEPPAVHDSTNVYPDEHTIEPVYHESKEPEKPIEDLIQSLVTEKYDTDTKPSDFDKDSHTQTPTHISSAIPEDDVKQTPQQHGAGDELSTQSSISAGTTLKELDEKVIMSTNYDISDEEGIRTDSPAYVEKIESETTTQKKYLLDDSITQFSGPEENEVTTTATFTEHKSTAERGDISDVDVTPSVIAPHTTEEQEKVSSNKPSIDFQQTATETSFTTEISEKQTTESVLEITKTPDIQTEMVPAETPEIPIGVEMSTDNPDLSKQQSELTTLEPSTETEGSSQFRPTTAPKKDKEGQSSSSEDAGYTGKVEEVNTKTSVVDELTTESASSEYHTEKQPESLQTATPEKSTPVEEFDTTSTKTTAAIEVVHEMSTHSSLISEEGSTPLLHDMEQNPPTEQQSIPVVISGTEKTSTLGEFIDISTEIAIHASEKPIQETTAPEEEFIIASSKVTTAKAEEELSTISSLVDRTAKPIYTPAESHSTTTSDAFITFASEAPMSAVPEEPVTSAPDSFITFIPEMPTTKTPELPVTAEAEAPVTKIPEVHITTEPEASEAPITSVPKTPITDAPEKSETTITSESEAATTGVPKAHEEPISDVPEATEAAITNVPEVPASDAHESHEESITHIPEVPEVAITSIPEAPISLSTETLEEPITNVPETPEAAVTSEPKAPITNAPEAHEESITNIPEAPETAITNVPEAPMHNIPEIHEGSITNEPETLEAAITNLPEVPTTTATKAQEESITNAPKMPEEAITNAPETPPSSELETPEATITNVPEATEAAITSATEASITSVPKAPITSAPELPESPMSSPSKAPITEVPELPITSAPDAHITKAPVLPVTAVPELPKPVSTEAQPTDAPEEEGSFPTSGGTSGYGQEPDYVEEDQTFGPGTCRYGGKVYVSAQQIPRDDPCDFCFCFRSDIICLQQSCPPPIHGCHEEPIQGFCCPRYECPVSMATTVNVTTTTTTTTTTLPPHFPTHSYKGSVQKRGCQIKGQTYKVGEVVRSSSGPCLHCTCGGDGQMKCDPKVCTPEPMLRQMIAAAVSAKRRR